MIEEKVFNSNINIESSQLSINFHDYNGNILKTLSIDYPISDEKILKFTPSPTQTYESGNYDYTFNNTWSKIESENTITFNPNYNSSRIIVTIKWLNYDESILQTKAYNKGDTAPSYTGSTPVRPDDTYRYTFSNWGMVSNTGRITIYIAQYTNAKLYTWKKYNTATMYYWNRYNAVPVGTQSTLIETNIAKDPTKYNVNYTSVMPGTYCEVTAEYSDSNCPVPITNGKYTLVNARSSWLQKVNPYGVCVIGRPTYTVTFVRDTSSPSNSYYEVKYTCGSETSGTICSKICGGIYYVYSLNTEPIKKEANGYAQSTNLSAYPSDGILGSYWYTRNSNKDTFTYVADKYVTIASTNYSAYPTNGRHTDGYWYIKQ